MKIVDIQEKDRATYNKLVTHPLQSYEWGEFRAKTGVKVVRKGLEKNGKLTDAFTVTIHPVPHAPYSIGYLPKGSSPTKELIEALQSIGKEHSCIFIQLEPDLIKNSQFSGFSSQLGLRPSHHPLFTRYTFTLDLTKSEDDLLADMHSKTRYNIRVAQRKGVTVSEESTDDAFKTYLKLTEETTKRQGFYAHTHKYHTQQWESLSHSANNGKLTSHLLTAKFEKETLASWILFAFHKTLYYPYGASSSTHRDKMASNLIMWEAIKFGKKLGLQSFDMWGALGPDPDTSDPWYGFHRFKQNYGAQHIEFVGSYDLVLNPLLYKAYQGADIMRWSLLKMKKRFT